MKQLEIAVIPGDGIGKEVVPAALDVLRTIADVHGGLRFTFTEFPWNCEYYIEHGKMMPDDGLQIWTAKMMLDHFGEEEMGNVLLKTIEDVAADGVKTPDIGGKATTREITEEICRRLKQLA
ncbi:D-malate dehydrogenase [Parageobacillus caldoxylosilyticus]|uniref:isocitrate/isopropylmalate family dehydrogenase n=1 Tax=Saccharococcus caldoxylosilyticus TaxID=81408 RepID=UPI001C4DECEC|nr:isocitrate/isopropylmalate family dehydrogenase [Parageobacillus caldoxylosilyticus]QXJ38512.1 D-malate dehydrogenase [Parageobacillus caldoxylosilyticus]